MARIEMTPEIRKQLEGVAPATPDSVFEIEPFEGELPTELSPVYTVKPFNREQKRKASQMIAQGANEFVKPEFQDKMFEIIRQCVVGWDRLYDLSSGEEIRFQPTATGQDCSADLWEIIPASTKTRLSLRLFRLSGMTEPEKKGLA